MGFRGFTLLQVMMGGLLAGAALWAAMSVFRQFSQKSEATLAHSQADMSVRSVGQFLKEKLEGSQSFQNLSFKLPALALSSDGPGFVVQPDTDVHGNARVGVDRLIVAVKEPLPTKVNLAGDLPGASLSLTSANGSTAISSLFATGTLLAVSNIQHTEIVAVTSNPTPSGATTATITFDADSYQYLVNTVSPYFRYTYLTGDEAFRARFLVIGFDNATGSVSWGPLGGTAAPIASGVTGFTVSYRLANDTARCPSVSGTNGGYARADWSTLNSDGGCYRRVEAVRFDYAITPRTVASTPTTPQRGSYVFNANF